MDSSSGFSTFRLRQPRGWVLATVAVGLLQTAAQAQTINTAAGNGMCALGGDGGVATSASLCNPQGIVFDTNGNWYIADSYNHRIRKVTKEGIISTVAGNGDAGFSGDSGAATNAMLSFPSGVAVDVNGNLYIADYANHRIRKVTATTGTISTIAGNGKEAFSGDGGAATSASLDYPSRVLVSPSGSDLYIADAGNQRIRKVTTMTGMAVGIITTVAGNGTAGFSGDGGAATYASLSSDSAGMALDVSGDLYIADSGNHRIRKVTKQGVISTVAGSSSSPAYAGDGGAATSARLNDPEGVTFDASGNWYIADRGNRRIRKITASGIISTVAGNGCGTCNSEDGIGDGGAATDAELYAPRDVALDASGNLYIADSSGYRIRQVTPSFADLVWRNTSTGANEIWPSADAAAKQTLDTVIDSSWQIAGVGDFDGSGQSDLLWRNTSNGANEIWRSANAGTKQAVATLSTASWKMAGVGDFNADGYSDILWRNTGTGASTAGNVIWLSGNSATPQSVQANGDQNWQMVGVGDFNKDGPSDILWRNASTGINAIWLSGNSKTYQKVASLSDLNWKVVGVGDFDNDKAADILWRHSGNGKNMLWKSANSATQVTLQQVSDQAWQVVGVDDVNGDGKDDIVWRHTAMGGNMIWQSGNYATTQSVASVKDTNWNIVGTGNF